MSHSKTNGSHSHANGHADNGVVASAVKAEPEPLDGVQILHLAKPLPGHLGVLLAVAGRLETARDIHVPKIEPAMLVAVVNERNDVAAKEAALAPTMKGLYDRRVTLDHRAMKALRSVARAVRASEDPEVKANWSFLIEFLGQYGKIGSRVRAANKAAKEKAAKDAQQGTDNTAGAKPAGATPVTGTPVA